MSGTFGAISRKSWALPPCDNSLARQGSAPGEIRNFISKSLYKAKTPSLGLAEPRRANELSHRGSAHDLMEIAPKGPDTLVASM